MTRRHSGTCVATIGTSPETLGPVVGGTADPRRHPGLIGYRGTATDITEEVEAQARANRLALRDSLTGLPNRVLFRERLDQAFEGSRHDTRRISVLCLDLDHFKEVNDTLGHAFGDTAADPSRGTAAAMCTAK